MSNRLFQGVIHQMRDAIDRTFGVVDESSVIIACSELGKIGEVNNAVTAESLVSPSVFVMNGYTFKSFGADLTQNMLFSCLEMMKLLKDMQCYWLYHSAV